MDFDPRWSDDPRDPREVFTRDLDLPRGPDRERVWFREHSVFLQRRPSRSLTRRDRALGDGPRPPRGRTVTSSSPTRGVAGTIVSKGFTERQARFLVLVARHSGVCVM